MKYDHENDESLTHMVSWAGRDLRAHHVRFCSEKEAIDFAVSLDVFAKVLLIDDYSVVFSSKVD